MEIQKLLKYGDIVKIRSGDILIVYSTSDGRLETYSHYTRTTGHGGYCSIINNDEYTLLYSYKELKKIQASGVYNQYDIVAILKRDNLKNLSPFDYSYLSYKITIDDKSADDIIRDINEYLKRNKIEWDWEEEISAKEMTVSAIEKILGYPIKIVKE
jgi:hypothetical protein